MVSREARCLSQSGQRSRNSCEKTNRVIPYEGEGEVLRSERRAERKACADDESGPSPSPVEACDGRSDEGRQPEVDVRGRGEDVEIRGDEEQHDRAERGDTSTKGRREDIQCEAGERSEEQMHEMRRDVVAESDRGGIEQVHVQGEEREPQVQIGDNPSLLHEVQRVRQVVANLVGMQGRGQPVQRDRDEHRACDSDHDEPRRCLAGDERAERSR